MDAERTLEDLVAADVLVEGGDGAELALSPSFRAERADQVRATDALEDAALETALREETDGLLALPEAHRERVDLLASARSLAAFLPERPLEERLKLLPVVDQFAEPPPRESGAPAAFTPVTDRQLRTLLRTARMAIVYVWRDDCAPCDLMARTFDEVFPEPLEDVALLAAYGPECPEAMAALGVEGAPTVLFLLEGSVDTRLHGAQHPEAIEAELETLRSLAVSD